MSALLANDYIESSGIVTVYLLLIVFAVLAFLVIVLSLGHRAMEAVRSKWQSRGKAAQPTPQPLPEPQSAATVVAEDEEEVVAAIVAAITQVLQAEAPEKKAKFVVRKIERI